MPRSSSGAPVPGALDVPSRRFLKKRCTKSLQKGQERPEHRGVPVTVGEGRTQLGRLGADPGRQSRPLPWPGKVTLRGPPQETLKSTLQRQLRASFPLRVPIPSEHNQNASVVTASPLLYRPRPPTSSAGRKAVSQVGIPHLRLRSLVRHRPERFAHDAAGAPPLPWRV